MKKLIISGFLLTVILTNISAQDPVPTPPPPAQQQAPPPTQQQPPPTQQQAPPTQQPAPPPVQQQAPPPAQQPAPAPAPAPQQSTSEDQKLMFGLKLAPTYCWFSLESDELDSDGGYVGYTYGVMTDFRIATNYYLATGIEISQRGGKFKSQFPLPDTTFSFTPGTVTQRLQFVDIPVSLKMKTKEIGYMRYYGSFGFLTGFLIKANWDIDYESSAIPDIDKSSNMSYYGSFNFGLLLGAGFEYKFSGNTAFTAGLQYHNAFVDMLSEDAGDGTLKSSFVGLNLGIFF